MKRKLLALAAIAVVAAAAMAAPQQFQLDLDQLSSKASNAVDLSLSGATLRFAARFLDSHDPDESQIQKLIAGLQGIYIKHFEFKRDNAYTQADLDKVRNQLRGPDWEKIVGVKDAEEGSNSEIYLHMVNGESTGVAIIESEAREVSVINIVGMVDLDQLSHLGGHFNIPKLEVPKDKKRK